MKLTADSQGRLGSAELFRPKADFEASCRTASSVFQWPLQCTNNLLFIDC